MKSVKKVLAVVMVMMSVFALAGCGGSGSKGESGGFSLPTSSPKYTAASRFLYSGDKGHTYGDGTKEYPINQTVYMKVQYKVTSNKKDVSQVKVVLTIPNVQNVDATYMDGQKIEPNYDPVNNVTTYEFTANASKEATESECVIQFVPNATGSVTMTLEYDDNLDETYDIMNTLVFVEPEADDAEGSTEGE